jgi:hypothetical protein
MLLQKAHVAGYSFAAALAGLHQAVSVKKL